MARKTLDHHPPWKRWATFVGIFALALMVRVPALGKFATIDEHRWLDRSLHFAGGLLFSNFECPPVTWGRQFAATGWECTLQIGYPGVTTMWGGGLGLVTYYWWAPRAAGVDVRSFLQTLPVNPFDPDLIAPARLPLTVTAALSVALFYILLRRLLEERVALVSALLLALNPFHIALSRVLHHDALTTTFMVLSLLAIVGYWLQGWKRRWLLFSGAMAGLAFLSKPVSWFMIPYAGLLGGLSLYFRWQSGQWRGWLDVRKVLGEGILWGFVAGLTFVALFPAMWTIPGEVIRSMFDIIQLAQEGHEQFFLGRASPDPGPLFYPVGWLFRASPLEVIGLLILLATAWRSARRQPTPIDQHTTIRPVLTALTVFLVTFVLFMSLSRKKGVRFFLPAFPVIDVFAALGLIKLWQVVSRKWPEASSSELEVTHHRLKIQHNSRLGFSFLLLITVVIVIQAIVALPHFPYYFTYHNPLLGGGRLAESLMLVGRGEGLDLAADYLNQKPNADQLKVTAWYEQIFAPYFQGETVPFFSIGGAMDSDYVVFYQNQLQRQLPDPNLLAYYQRHYTPEHIVHLKGIDYALVYPVPLDRRTEWQLTNVFGKLILYGYRQEGSRPGRLSIQLVWENKGLSQEDGLWAALQHCEGGAHPLCSASIVWQPCTLAPGFSDEAQRSGALVESVCELDIGHLAPGIYSLHVGLGPSLESQSAADSLNSQRVTDLMPPQGELGVAISSDVAPALISPDQALDALAMEVLPSGVLPMHVSYGNVVALTGYQFAPLTPDASQTATVTLYWQALQDVLPSAITAQGFQVRFDLLAPDGTPVGATANHLLSSTTIGDVWQAGQVLTDNHQIPLPDHLPPGDYRLTVALTDADSSQPVPALDEATGLITSDPIQLNATITLP